MATGYDIIIIGGGSAGLGALGMAASLGWKPLLIEKDEANIGGDCLNYGCVPSKALIHLAKQFKGASKASQFGLKVDGQANIKKILEYVHQKQEVIRAHESADWVRAQGIDLEIGTASFLNEDTIQVGEKTFQSNRIILATGSRPRHIPFKGIELVKEVYTNENLFYEMKNLPGKLLVVGGGPIGCEMAQVFARFGSKVYLVDRGERILEKERPEMSTILAEELRKEGVEIINKANLKEFIEGEKALIEVEGKEQLIEFDAVLIAVGRVLNLESLNLLKGAIKTTAKGKIVLDEYLRSSNKNVFAVGDCAGMYQFSHGAEKHIKLLSENFKNGFNTKHEVADLSWVTFTDPEIATFGFSEDQLKEQKIAYWRQDQNFHDDDRAIVGEYQYGQMSLFLSDKKWFKKGRRILGGSIIAPNAGEIVQELILAMNEELPIDSIYNKLYPYPTQSRINQQTVMGVINNDKKE